MGCLDQRRQDGYWKLRTFLPSKKNEGCEMVKDLRDSFFASKRKIDCVELGGGWWEAWRLG